jgi:transcriptional regulator with XRE-family HTH domain
MGSDVSSGIAWATCDKQREGCNAGGVKTLGERLAFALKLSGMTAAQVARDAGVSTGYLSRIQAGARENVGHKNLAKIAYALRVSTHWLSTGEGEIEAQGVTKLGVASQLSAVDEAIATIDWPGEYDTDDAARMVAEIRREAMRPGAEGLPVKFWLARMRNYFQHRKT